MLPVHPASPGVANILSVFRRGTVVRGEVCDDSLRGTLNIHEAIVVLTPRIVLRRKYG
jgi:hypothetical protein